MRDRRSNVACDLVHVEHRAFPLRVSTRHLSNNHATPTCRHWRSVPMRCRVFRDTATLRHLNTYAHVSQGTAAWGFNPVFLFYFLILT